MGNNIDHCDQYRCNFIVELIDLSEFFSVEWDDNFGFRLEYKKNTKKLRKACELKIQEYDSHEVSFGLEDSEGGEVSFTIFRKSDIWMARVTSMSTYGIGSRDTIDSLCSFLSYGTGIYEALFHWDGGWVEKLCLYSNTVEREGLDLLEIVFGENKDEEELVD